MAHQNTKTTSLITRRWWWRKPWVLIVVWIAIVFLTFGALLVIHQYNQSKQTPHTLLTRILSQTNDTALTAGGVWTFEDKSAWSPSDTSGYTGTPCGNVNSGPQQYPVQLNSGGVVDPSSSASQVAKRWKSLGYSVRTVVPPQADNSDFTQIATDLPNGAKLVYSVSTKTSGIDALSECSSDPAMLNKTQ